MRPDRRPGEARRGPPRRRRPFSVDRALASPARNLIGGALFVLIVGLLGILAYVRAGWSFGDALYMAVITIFTVGFDEVRPIDTAELRAITIALICLGCTGMIFVTGALIQFISAIQFSELLDTRRMNNQIDGLDNHIIVCGYGRLGMQLALEFAAAGTPFVIVERSEERCVEARSHGYLALCADATEEDALQRAGIGRARALATVLPNDAANVFITLSARGIHGDIAIVARGESPATERLLKNAGANRVVLPAHIGAERIAELILFPGIDDPALGPRASEKGLRRLGLEFAVVIAARGCAWEGLLAREIERRAGAAFLIVEVERAGSGARERPGDDTRIHAGDGVVVVGRSVAAAVEGFGAG